MDTEYCISSAMELGEISPLEGIVLNTHPAVYQAVREIVDHDLPTTTPDWIANECRLVLHKSPERYRQAVSLLALRSRDLLFKNMIERLESLVQCRVSRDLGWAETNGSYNELLTGRRDLGPTLFTRESDVNEELVHKLLNQSDTALSAKLRLQQDYSEFKQTVRQLTGECSGDLPLQLAYLLENAPAPSKVQVAQSPVSPAARRTQRKLGRDAVTQQMRRRAQSAIKKASKLFTSMGKSKDLSMFIAGDTVTLSHPDSELKFVVRSLGSEDWLIRRSVSEFTAHTPFELSLLTKSDVFLGNLCVYFAESPVLDQLLSLSLFIEAGEEEALLEKANVFGNSHWNEAFFDQLKLSSPALQKKWARMKPVGGYVTGKREIPVPRSMQLWKPFSNPTKQWIQAWLGKQVREYMAIPVPMQLAALGWDRMDTMLRGYLGVAPSPARCAYADPNVGSVADAKHAIELNVVELLP